ncbi:hypothetical protein K439DRAFT_119131 [Ramaria rubella]|nr:hypothetical protein K439DRAFT_119131 [Ramaria rubella]
MQQTFTSDSLLFRLQPHRTARNQAVACSSLPVGTTLLAIAPLAAILVESEKGRRCDLCFRPRAELHRCTGCKQYWYCGSTCQMKAWKAHHREMCKCLPGFITSQSYERLPSSGRLHLLLLTHLLAEHRKALKSAFFRQEPLSEDLSDPITTFLSLLPSGDEKSVISKLPLANTIPDELIRFLSCRFANNNFTIHTFRMDVFAHGVFPLASRSFNHSCVPSAVPVYNIMMPSHSTSITMEIKSICAMRPGEEITIPYIDPALPRSSRQRDLNVTYGFTCTCPLCQDACFDPSDKPISSRRRANGDQNNSGGISLRFSPGISAGFIRSIQSCLT